MPSPIEKGGMPPGMSEGDQEQLRQKLFLIYRDNPLLRDVVPEVTTTMSGLNYQVVEQKFAEGTPEAQIAEWGRANMSQLMGQKLMTDETFNRSIGRDATGKLENWSPALDDAVEDATFRAVFGQEWKPVGGSGLEHRPKGKDLERDVNFESGRELMLAMLKRILAKPENTPDKVVIAASRIHEHAPLSQFFYNELGKLNQEYIAKTQAQFPDFDPDFMKRSREIGDDLKAEGWKLVTSEDYNKFNDEVSRREDEIKERFQSFCKNNPGFKDFGGYDDNVYFDGSRISHQAAEIADQKAAQTVHDWLVGAGIPSENISLAKIGEYAAALPPETTGKSWVIGDRHYVVYGRGNTMSINNEITIVGKGLQVPLGNFFITAARAGLLEASPEEIKRMMPGVIQERYGK